MKKNIYGCLLILLYISTVSCNSHFSIDKGRINQIQSQKKIGLWITCADSTIVKKHYNKDGLLDGAFIMIFSDGAINTGKYKDGELDGFFKTYTPKGILVSKVKYKKGKEIKRRIYSLKW